MEKLLFVGKNYKRSIMEENEMKDKDQSSQSAANAREEYLKRMRERMGDEIDWEGDPEARYNAFRKYDDEQQATLGKYQESNQKLSELFSKNPRFAAMMSDMLKGTDASVAFVKYFGKEALEASGDEEKLKLITEANQEYLNQVAESEKLRKTQEENLQKSEEDISSFQQEKELNDEDYGKFIDSVYHVIEDGLEGRLTKEFLQIFWQGLNYETDIQSALKTGEIEGKNQKIELENRTQKGDNVPNLSSSNLSKKSEKKPLPLNKKKDFFDDFPID